jgi:glycosyltransferase involved in cell wall biosynthesis
MKVAVLFHRLGPYHFARLIAANKVCHLHVIELSSVDDTYAWDVIDEERGFERTTLFTDSDVERKSSSEITRVLGKTFIEIEPDAVAIPGWSGRAAFLALELCRKLRIPAIAMSDSTEFDQARQYWKEVVKKRVVGNFSAALVGGKPHTDYMYKLGMPHERIFSGYDVVDNSYFLTGAENARKNEKDLRIKYSLPANYFLGSSRFVPKKNLHRLISAYSEYRKVYTGPDMWRLVLLGDGEMRPQLEVFISELSLENYVLLPGFKQYPDLPVYYGLAKAYVLASTTEQWGLVVNEAMASGLPVLVSERCGCAADLVERGRNGFTFDPYNVVELAGLMLKLSSSESELTTMGEASQAIISRLTPETFAVSLGLAAEAAIKSPMKKFKLFDKLILKGLGLK